MAVYVSRRDPSITAEYGKKCCVYAADIEAHVCRAAAQEGNAARPDTPMRDMQSGSQDSQSHQLRGDNASEALFPLRKNSADVYKARDITQRAPSVAPSTMVPSSIPYPGVYNNTQTLTTGMPSSASVSSKSSGSFASAALNAAGLPSRVGFFGLGRKTSKRVGSNAHSRREGTLNSGNLSISSPLQPPPEPAITASSSTRSSNHLRPSGPRPSSSSNFERDGYAWPPSISSRHSHASITSLATLSSSSPMSTSLQANQPAKPLTSSPSSLAYSSAVNTEDELLTSMSDILPHASKDVLVHYLRAARGDHLDAIGRFLEDEKAGRL